MMMQIPGWMIGELVGVIAFVAMLASDETGKRPEPLRLVLGLVHGLAAFAGLEIALWNLNTSPTWLATVFSVANLFNFAIAGVMFAMVYPERAENGSSRAMWEVTFGPFVVAAVWGAVSFWILGRDGGDWLSLLEQSVVVLALHYVLVTGAIIVLLLFDPPPKSPAAKLELRERLASGMGRIWIGLVVLWMGQACFAFSAHWDLVFGESTASFLVALVLSGTGVYRTARFGHEKAHRAAAASKRT